MRSNKKRKRTNEESSEASSISTHGMEKIVNQLMMKQHRDSTAKKYLAVWRQFNKFVIQLDRKPKFWEDRTTLFIGYLINKGMQSSTVKSYVSAIKETLVLDGYKWNDDLVLIRSLAKACRIVNDRAHTRLPIHCGLLEMILFEVQRYFSKENQWYLEILYKTLFAVSYYGLMRIGEVTRSQHVLKAKDVHIAKNKDKMMLILYSSKTHGKNCRPQKIIITSNSKERTGKYSQRNFCPFTLMRQYLHIRGGFNSQQEQFFVFRDLTPVTASQARNVLKLMIRNLNLDESLYGMHSFRIGRTTDLIKYNYTIDEVKLLGSWRSNVIFKYIR